MVFLKVLKATKLKEREMRILILGLDNAGKTTIVNRLNGEPIDKIPPTLGFSIKTLEHEGFQLNIWDVGGQKTIRAFWRNYFEENDALVWVIDSADIVRLNDCKNELHKLLQEQRLAGCSLLILANKRDLDGALSLENIRQVILNSLNNLKILMLDSIISHNFHLQPCSAVTNEGLLEGFDWVVHDVANRIHLIGL